MVIAKVDFTTPFGWEDELKKMKFPKEHTTKIGESVKIKSIKKEGLDPEDFYYLKKFENQTGTIAEQNKCKSGIYTYKVEFDQNNFGYFYYEDFIFTNENNPK